MFRTEPLSELYSKRSSVYRADGEETRKISFLALSWNMNKE